MHALCGLPVLPRRWDREHGRVVGHSGRVCLPSGWLRAVSSSMGPAAPVWGVRSHSTLAPCLLEM